MKSLFFLFFCLTAAAGFAQEVPTPPTPLAPPPSIPNAIMEFDDTEFDFGTVEQGDVVKHVFTFTNTSDEMLILTNAKGSCGCTVPQWPNDPIAPGETASIAVEFNTKGKRGKQNKRVTITANTEIPQTFLYVKGTVSEPENTEERAEPEENITEAADPDCFAIFPNPTTEILQLDVSDHLGKHLIISIFSKSGQLMARREIEKAEETEIFNVAHYPAGTYLANVQAEGKSGASKCFVVTD